MSDVGKKKKQPDDITVSDDDPTILHEDNHILVAVKPQNVPSQADATGDPDFLSQLKYYLVKKYNKPGNAYLGLLHRLDRPTGGVMVFAKTSKAAGRLSEQIRDGEFEKTYAAVVSGRPNRTGSVEHYLVKDEKTNTVTLAPASLEGAKLAKSNINILEEKNGLSLVSVQLLTGRTHQARVQLKALASPIVGDRRYGGDKYVPAPHLALWAYKLAFTHPVTGEALKFISLPPNDEFPWSEFDTDALVDLVRPIEKRRY
ncbi:MAG: RluA family pseudouridine synthase [Clostridiales bacterium]|nr:RluA family pseudouridine synthase [Clostridiales bacterium]